MTYTKRCLLTLLVTTLFLCPALAQFIQNKGQVLDLEENAKPEVRFYYSAPEASIYFQKDRIVYAFLKKDHFDESVYENNARAKDSVKAKLGFTMYRMDMEFVNANPNPEVIHGEKIPGDIHFYLNKRNGIRDVGSYKSITYKNIYNNIDVIFYQLESGLKYDIVLHEGARIEDVKIFYNGAENVSIENKTVHIKTKYKTLKEAIPLAFINGDKNNEVEIEYTVDDKGILSFKKPSADYKTLTIDPVLEWATYFNQPDATFSSSMDYYDNRLDADGNTYLYGHCYNGANGYPVINPGGSAYQASWVSYSDLYIAKFNTNRTLVWGTYFGGSGSEMCISSQALAIYGNTLHVVGNEMSAGAPYTNGGGFYAQNTSRPFWARFNKNTCQLEHLTSLPGGSSSSPSIAISNSGNVAIISHTYGDSFYNISIVNRPGAYNQATNGGYLDMYLMMFNTAYTQTWGTFLGGPSSQEYFMCAFDNSDNLYFMGETSWFASGANAGNATNERLVQLPGAYYQGTAGGGTDAMIGKFNSSGALVWHTLFGGNNSDVRRGQQGGFGKLLIHPTTQEAFIAFNTTSNNLPVNNLPGAYNKTVPTHPDFGGNSGSFWNYAAYIAKFSTAGVLNYSSYWHNGNGGDLIMDITWAGCDKLYIGGNSDRTNSGQAISGGFNLPTISSVNGRNAFITQVNSNTYAQEWASFINENTSSDPSITGHLSSPRVYVAAKGYYNTIPTVDPGNSAYYNSNGNAPTGAHFGIWQLHPALPPDVTGDLDLCSGESTTLTASGGTGAPYNWYSSNTATSTFHVGNVYNTPALTGSTTYYVSSGSGMCESPRVPVAVVVNPGGGGAHTVNGGGTICSGSPGVAVGLNGSDAGISYQLQLGGSDIGTPVTGTGSSISFGIQNQAGTYTVIVSGGGGGCAGTMTGTATITVITTPAIPSITSNSPICAGNTLQLNGPTLTATDYFWTGPNGFSSSFQNPQITSASTAATGTYSLYVVSGSCTSGTATQNITVNPSPATPSFSANTPCEGATLNLTTAAVAGATYVWSGPNSFSSGLQNPSISNAPTTASGTYNLYIVADGCTSATTSQAVTVNPRPVITGTVTNPSNCAQNNGSIQINGTGTGSIGWTGPGFSFGGVPSVTLPHTMHNFGAGSYSVLFVSAEGCTSNVYNAVLVAPSAPATPTFTTNSPVCAGGSIQFDAPTIANATYVWSGPNSFSSSIEDPSIANATAAQAGTYNLYVVVNNCTSATATQTVSVSPQPAMPSITSNSPVCEGSTLNLSTPAVSGASYSWSGPNAFTSTVQEPSITGVSSIYAGTYTLTLTTNACTSQAAQTTITVNPVPATPTFTTNSPICEGDSLTLTATPVTNASYAWNGPNGFTSTSSSASINPATTSTAGSYTLTVTVNGCTSQASSQNVVVNATPSTPIITHNGPLCSGNTLNLGTASQSGATYVWTGPDSFTSANQNPAISNTDTDNSGNYNLYVIINGCSSATATENIAIFNIPPAPTIGSNSPVCVGSTLSLNASSTGASSFHWTGPNAWTSSNQNPSINTTNSSHSGTYSVYTLIGTCTSATATITVVIETAPTITYSGPTSNCGNQIPLAAQSSPGSTVEWFAPSSIGNGNTFNYNFNETIPTTLTGFAIATSTNNCSDTTNFSILISDLPVADFSFEDLCDSVSVQLEDLHTPSSGSNSTTYTWSWNGGSSTLANPSVSFNSPGNYSVTMIVSSSGAVVCSDTLTKNITVLPVPELNITTEEKCLQEIVFTGAASPDSALQNITWNFGNGQSGQGYNTSHSYEQPGNYTVKWTVETANGCEFSATQNIDVKLSTQNIPEKLPNIFTPNGDAANNEIDFEQILGECGEYEVVYYNRWGNTVFTQKNGTSAFAGRSNLGTDLNPGVYYYVIRYGDSKKGGNITLIR